MEAYLLQLMLMVRVILVPVSYLCPDFQLHFLLSRLAGALSIIGLFFALGPPF